MDLKLFEVYVALQYEILSLIISGLFQC